MLLMLANVQCRYAFSYQRMLRIAACLGAALLSHRLAADATFISAANLFDPVSRQFRVEDFSKKGIAATTSRSVSICRILVIASSLARII